MKSWCDREIEIDKERERENRKRKYNARYIRIIETFTQVGKRYDIQVEQI